MNESMKVLYVEDDADIRAVAEMALDGEGFELIVCKSGQEALEKATDCTPDILLLDVMMPGMDGPTTLERLRRLPHLKNTPVVFMTAKIQPDEMEQYKALGALGIIAKPFNPMALADELRALIEK